MKAETTQHILITGGASRIGLELSQYYVGLGCRVTVHHHSSPCPSFVNPPHSSCIRANLTRPEECKLLIEKAITLRGPITTIIHNAALFSKTGTWDSFQSINLAVPRQLSELFQAQLIQTQLKTGNIVFILDTFAERGFSEYASYAASKMACMGLMKTLAREWSPRIRTNAISPGYIQFPNDKVHSIKFTQGKMGHPLDIAHASRFLIENSYINGFCLRVDGGKNLTDPLTAFRSTR